MFSYARNSCARNHDRYTLCAFHWHNDHKAADWRECQECRDNFHKTEDYVWLATNEFSFVKLENPPSYEPSHCAKCNIVINLGNDGYSIKGRDYLQLKSFCHLDHFDTKDPDAIGTHIYSSLTASIIIHALLVASAKAAGLHPSDISYLTVAAAAPLLAMPLPLLWMDVELIRERLARMLIQISTA